MAKNYADTYASTNDVIALNQRFYLKLEAVKGTLIGPASTDYLWTLGGGALAYSQPMETSPHRSGRHNTGFIKKKKQTTWQLKTYFNIDESLGSASVNSVDPAVRLLFKSLLGKEDDTGGFAAFNSSSAPDITFSMLEIGDKWSRQGRACFVDAATFTFPGNGEATIDWSGSAKDAFFVGIGKSIIANTGNNITVASGEGELFPVGSIVMVIKANGTTRSTDTAAGSYRTITAVVGDVITLSGATLSDVDGSTTPIYLCYYEPAAATGINNPVTGLVGSMNVAGVSVDCFRQVTLTLTNNHEKVDYCFGSDSLDDPFFVPGSRLDVKVSIETNLNVEIMRMFNRVAIFESQNLTLELGDAAGRHFQALLPKVIFNVPAIAIPDTGSVPVTFDGTAEQTVLDAADEITMSYP